MHTIPPTILLVEDDRFLRHAAQLALRNAGYRVLTAVDGEEGLHLARTAAPDIILLDLLMPKLSGLEVLRALRAEPATRALPVLVLSNSSLERTVTEVQTLGAEYVVKANLSLRELVQWVARMVAEGAPVLPPAAP